MQQVLVTGAGGRIGRAVIDRLAEEGLRTVGLSLEYRGPSQVHRRLVGDARSADDVRAALEGVDAVVHLAAIPHPSLGTPTEVFTTNVTSTFTVLAEAAAAGVRRAVIASSINASGIPMNPHPVLPAYFPIDEQLPADLADAYSLSKHADEATARMAHRAWGLETVALRFPFTATRAELLAARDRAAADAAPHVREGWSYLDVRDAAEAVLAALRAPLAGPLVAGLAADDLLVDRDTAELLAEHAPDVPLRRPIGRREALVDTAVARRELGFHPRHSVHRAEPGALDGLATGRLSA
jgi:nucleoside-diphosphate-sugar epimerase